MSFAARTAVLIAAIVATCALLWKVHYTGKTIGRAEVTAKWNLDKLKQSEASRAREKALTAQVEKVRNDYAKQKARLVADARVTADRLREYEAAASRTAGDTSATSGTNGPFAAIAGECARSLAALDEHAQGLRATASALQEYANGLRLK
jgi:hypothetical protein